MGRSGARSPGTGRGRVAGAGAGVGTGRVPETGRGGGGRGRGRCDQASGDVPGRGPTSACDSRSRQGAPWAAPSCADPSPLSPDPPPSRSRKYVRPHAFPSLPDRVATGFRSSGKPESGHNPSSPVASPRPPSQNTSARTHFRAPEPLGAPPHPAPLRSWPGFPTSPLHPPLHLPPPSLLRKPIPGQMQVRPSIPTDAPIPSRDLRASVPSWLHLPLYFPGDQPSTS